MFELIELRDRHEAVQAATREQHVSQDGFRHAHLVCGDEAFLDLLPPVRTARVRKISMAPVDEFFGDATVKPALNRGEQIQWSIWYLSQRIFPTGILISSTNFLGSVARVRAVPLIGLIKGNELLVFIRYEIQKTFALPERTLDCRTALLVSPHKVHSQKQVLRSMEGCVSCSAGETKRKVTPKAVAEPRSHLPLMTGGRSRSKCDSLLGTGDQYRCKVSDLGGSRVLCGTQL
jgi:hypothetical protein